jgi:hypothetical protein
MMLRHPHTLGQLNLSPPAIQPVAGSKRFLPEMLREKIGKNSLASFHRCRFNRPKP